jgi:hypothetical protein
MGSVPCALTLFSFLPASFFLKKLLSAYADEHKFFLRSIRMSNNHRTSAEKVWAKLKLTGMTAVALSFIMMLVLAGCPLESDPEPADTAVSATDLTSLIAAPAAGAAPQLSIAASQYTGTITWTAAGAGVSGNFAASTVYQAAVALTAKQRFTFKGTGVNVFTHNGPERHGVH